MKKNWKRYLVAHWCPARGHTMEKPPYYLGPYNYIVKSLKEVDMERCYKSEKMAMKEAAKLNYGYWFAAVIEVGV